MRRSRRPLIETQTATIRRRGSSRHPSGLETNLEAASRAIEAPPGDVKRARLRLPTAHRDTTAVLGGGYPFLTSRPATTGMFIGHEVTTGEPFCFDPWQLYADQMVSNTNIAIIGNIGWGKTNTAMALALRGIAHGYRIVVPGDPKNDWTRLATALGGQSIRLGPGMPDRLNPLDLGTPANGGATDGWRQQAEQRRAALLIAITESVAPALVPLRPELRETLLDALVEATKTNTILTLPQLVSRLGDQAEANPIRAALATLCNGPLAGMLDQPGTATPDPAAPIIAVGTAAVADNDLAHTLAVLTATSQLDRAATFGRRLIVYDEAWRILAAPTHLARVNTELRLSRARKTSTVLITHALSDTDKAADADSSAAATARGLIALCDTRIIFRQAPGETDRTATELHLTDPERATLTALGKGEALWKTGTTTRRIHTDLSTTEAGLFNTDDSDQPR